MGRFYTNVAKSYVGRKVNLHLRDQSVIVNVLVTGVKGNSGKPRLHYRTPGGVDEISMRDLDWVQPLDPLFNVWRDGRA